MVRKTPHRDQRYEVKHHVIFRNDDTIYELPHSQVSIVETPIQYAASDKAVQFESCTRTRDVEATTNLERVKDQEFFSEFFSGLKPGFSKALGALYWKGPVNLIDGSRAEVLVMESPDGDNPSYSIKIAGPNPPTVISNYRARNFKSARHAVLQLEKDMNREIYISKKE